ncbi:SU10 major capsid protein [Nonomuraea sp. bgisy101]|uniref:SU10 major capsid protein n=1 Tax=Nonomuraea sp. bgisy101 TaxID=3413784 RepID=UPI003D7288A4
MAGITALGTTYNLPNYTGILHQLTPGDTPFFSAIGGLVGGGQTDSVDFEWETFDLRAAAQTTRVEGADAPAEEERVRGSVNNLVQIHQETVGVSWTKLAATQLKSGINNAERNPVGNELDWQVEQMLKQMVRDVEFSFIQGVYQKPVDNTTPRRTRGLLGAISTNVIANGTAAALTEDMVMDLLQMVWENGGIQESETATLMCNAFQKRMLTKIFITDKNYQEASRTVGGVRVTMIETDFGTLNIMLNRHMPAAQLAVVSLEHCRPVYQEIPGKGHFFATPLAQTGAKDKTMLYGEVGLAYGNEKAHGKITNLTITAP